MRSTFVSVFSISTLQPSTSRLNSATLLPLFICNMETKFFFEGKTSPRVLSFQFHAAVDQSTEYLEKYTIPAVSGLGFQGPSPGKYISHTIYSTWSNLPKSSGPSCGPPKREINFKEVAVRQLNCFWRSIESNSSVQYGRTTLSYFMKFLVVRRNRNRNWKGKWKGKKARKGKERKCHTLSHSLNSSRAKQANDTYKSYLLHLPVFNGCWHYVL